MNDVGSTLCRQCIDYAEVDNILARLCGDVMFPEKSSCRAQDTRTLLIVSFGKHRQYACSII